MYVLRWLAAAALLTIAACITRETAVPHLQVRITAGPIGSQPYRLGKALGDVYSSTLPDIGFIVDGIGSDSLGTIARLHDGTADIGFAFGDAAYLAFMGHSGQQPLDRIRAIGVLQPRPLHMLVRAGSHIRSVTDLPGHRVAIDPTSMAARLVLHSYGVELDTLHLVSVPKDGAEAVAAFDAGELDAILSSTSDPSEPISVVTRAGIRLLPLTGPTIGELRADYPFLRPVAIRGGTYDGHRSVIPTIGVDHLLICRADLDPTLVYTITKRLLEGLPALVSMEPSFRRLDVSRAASAPIPLHAGAARYYRERELAR